MRTIKNLFCSRSNLQNEADVEAIFVERLLKALNYPDKAILRKRSLAAIKVGRGSAKEYFKPDYVLLDGAGEPIIVLDAKAPSEKCRDYLYQVSGYALHLNQQAKDNNPVRYVVLTNGLEFYVFPWDSATPSLYLTFEAFDRASEKFLELRSHLSYGVFDQVSVTKAVFDFQRPALGVLVSTFARCHNLIWKKEKLAPTDAFYAFAKIMFVKIREDQRIHTLIASGRQLKKEEFLFSQQWIASQKPAEDNPIDSILFRHLQEGLEDEIRRGTKKRIFLQGEGIGLRPSTILEVVKELEHFDLYGIDEDLNGRMFETFLNATVRGKALGQFFTPRGVVHYMTDTVTLPLTKEYIPKVLDGCCGSGGFLIDAMARLFRDLDNIGSLTDRERTNRKKKIQDCSLYGIDANEKITRIARLNMYLHGDGGSKIFKADSLDKELQIEPGILTEEKDGLQELQSEVASGTFVFDAILTNPPFSMDYKSSDVHEKRVLEQYSIAKGASGATASSAASNILFIERYLDLLKPGSGELLTIIDDTVLNGINSQQYRNYILDNFIILQVISLPFNTFFRAEANIKTSILHLRRKAAAEQQSSVFMAITNNIGHDDHQKDTPHRNNLHTLAQLFHEWRRSGQRANHIINNEHPDEPLGCPMQVFTVDAKDLNPTRLDAFYYSAELRQLRSRAFALHKRGAISLKAGKDFAIVPLLTKSEVDALFGQHFKYFEIGDVTRSGVIVNFRQDTIQNLPTRGRLRVRTGDVIFAKNNSSRGTTVVIPEWFDGGLVTTGFIAVRPRHDRERHLLALALSDEFVRKQIYGSSG
ncbi:MAG: N-6 DNA methylase [Planctomycetaceae bacterium]|nr:N-6 DNA methylase [Planctomycetaceae bacterium]